MTTLENNYEPLNLRELISQQLKSYQPVATQQNSLFVNEVKDGLPVVTNQDALITLLHSLFYIIARCSRDTRIKISAKSFHDVMVLHIRDTNTINNYSVLYELGHLKMLANEIGGSLEITSQRNKETTIAFSFINSDVLPRLFAENSPNRQLQCA